MSIEPRVSIRPCRLSDSSAVHQAAIELNQIDAGNRRANLGCSVRSSAPRSGVATAAVRALPSRVSWDTTGKPTCSADSSFPDLSRAASIRPVLADVLLGMLDPASDRRGTSIALLTVSECPFHRCSPCLRERVSPWASADGEQVTASSRRCTGRPPTMASHSSRRSKTYNPAGAVASLRSLRRTTLPASRSASPCPNCRADSTRTLDELSRLTALDYHRCRVCDHVWSTNRQTHQIVMHVTRDELSQAGCVNQRVGSRRW